MSSDRADIDLIAAALRADGDELHVYLNVLAAKLEDAVPDLVEVDRRRDGMLSRRRVVTRLVVTCGEQRYLLEPSGGSLRATRAQVVRGIVLDRDELPLEEWVDALSAALARHAEQTEQGRRALGRLLG